MTDPAPTGTAAEKQAMREAARRRQAVDLLRVTEATVSYAITQLGNGLDRSQARDMAQEVAGELVAAAAALRRLTRLSARERRRVAASLFALGVPTQEVADRLGVSYHAAWGYRRGVRADGQPWADR
jgi:DNA-binding CsgD family transcriptional regulator